MMSSKQRAMVDFSGLERFFDVEESTFVSVEPSKKAYALIRNFVALHTDQSYALGDKGSSPGGCASGCEAEEKENEAKTTLVAGLGLHAFTFEKQQLYMVLQTHGEPVGTNCGPAVHTTMTLFNPAGLGQKELIHKFVEYLIALDEEKVEGFIKVYSWHPKYMYWAQDGVRFKRPMTSIIIDDKTKKKVTDDIASFLSADSREWFNSHGIPFKRSYMFYGPPGSGKSSFITALASQFDRNVCFLQPSHDLMTDDAFKMAMKKVPKNSVIVLEDIDSLFTKSRQKLNPRCPLTFSGFLNGLDGFGSPEGQLFMLTTNYLDRLDSALIRAGRVDLKVELGKASSAQIRQMFLSFYPGEEELAEQFAQRIIANAISMAALQNHFIQHRLNPASVAMTQIDIEELVQQQKLFQEQEEKRKKKEDEEHKKKEEEKLKEDELEKKAEEEEKEGTSEIKALFANDTLAKLIKYSLEHGLFTQKIEAPIAKEEFKEESKLSC